MSQARAPRGLLFVALSLLCLGLALRQRLAPPAPPLVVDLVAPPLTRIDALGDRPLATGGPLPAGPPPGGPLPAGPPPGGPPPGGPGADPRGHALRLQVVAHAQALADRLGPARVGWALAHREELSAELAETATWQGLVQALRETD